MKIIPSAPVTCAMALLGLSLVPIALGAAGEEKVPDSVLKKYDANRDGTLDETERAAWQADKDKQRAAREARHAEELTRYDTNQDGKINRDERAAIRADDEKARAEKQAARAAQKVDKAAAAEARKLAKYDKNGDGKLDEEEAAAMKADEEKRRAAADKRKATIEARQKDGGTEPGADER